MILEYVRKEPHWSHPSSTLCLRGLLGAGEMKQRGLKKGFGTGGIVSCYPIIIDQKEFASFIRAVLDVERCHRWVTWCTSGPETGAKGGGKDHNLGFNLIYFLMVKLLHLKSKYENKPLQNYLIGKSIVFFVTSFLLPSCTNFDLNPTVFQLLGESCEVCSKCRSAASCSNLCSGYIQFTGRSGVKYLQSQVPLFYMFILDLICVKW